MKGLSILNQWLTCIASKEKIDKPCHTSGSRIEGKDRWSRLRGTHSVQDQEGIQKSWYHLLPALKSGGLADLL